MAKGSWCRTRKLAAGFRALAHLDDPYLQIHVRFAFVPLRGDSRLLVLAQSIAQAAEQPLLQVAHPLVVEPAQGVAEDGQQGEGARTFHAMRLPSVIVVTTGTPG